MGCDGGTIPTRGEMVRLKKKPEKKDQAADLAAKWRGCAITQEPLRQPIVACELGRLYNKESVIELLLDRSKFECAASFDHLKGLKDIKELGLTDNSAYKEPPKGDKGDAYVDRHTSPYVCPVTGLEMSGRYRFVFLHGCGCVFAERAMKELKTDACHKCGKSFSPDDVIVLNGDDDDVSRLREQMEERRKRAKLEKKAKRKHKAESTVTSATEQSTEGDPSSSKQPRVEEELPSTSKATNGTNSKLANGAAGTSSKLANGAAGTSSKLANGAAGTSSKLANGAAGKSSKLTNVKGATGQAKDKSIQKNPNASDTFKSLFTTCEKARRQPKAHWVTHNPQYY